MYTIYFVKEDGTPVSSLTRSYDNVSRREVQALYKLAVKDWQASPQQRAVVVEVCLYEGVDDEMIASTMDEKEAPCTK